MNEVLDGLWIGDVVAAQDSELLALHGITHVLDLAGLVPEQPGGGEVGEAQKVVKLEVHVDDTETTDMSQHFNKMSDFIAQGRQQGRVLVHCFQGKSRSACAMAAHLMLEEQMKLVSALRAVQSARRSIKLNSGFKRQLMELEKRLYPDAPPSIILSTTSAKPLLSSRNRTTSLASSRNNRSAAETKTTKSSNPVATSSLLGSQQRQRSLRTIYSAYHSLNTLTASDGAAGGRSHSNTGHQVSHEGRVLKELSQLLTQHNIDLPQPLSPVEVTGSLRPGNLKSPKFATSLRHLELRPSRGGSEQDSLGPIINLKTRLQDAEPIRVSEIDSSDWRHLHAVVDSTTLLDDPEVGGELRINSGGCVFFCFFSSSGADHTERACVLKFDVDHLNTLSENFCFHVARHLLVPAPPMKLTIKGTPNWAALNDSLEQIKGESTAVEQALLLLGESESALVMDLGSSTLDRHATLFLSTTQL